MEWRCELAIKIEGYKIEMQTFQVLETGKVLPHGKET